MANVLHDDTPNRPATPHETDEVHPPSSHPRETDEVHPSSSLRHTTMPRQTVYQVMFSAGSNYFGAVQADVCVKAFSSLGKAQAHAVLFAHDTFMEHKRSAAAEIQTECRDPERVQQEITLLESRFPSSGPRSDPDNPSTFTWGYPCETGPEYGVFVSRLHVWG